MGDSEELRAGEYKITWKPVTSSRIDTAALKKALPDVAAAFTRSTTVRRFCVAENGPLHQCPSKLDARGPGSPKYQREADPHYIGFPPKIQEGDHNTVNNLGQAFAEMLYNRMENGDFLQRLQDSSEYAQAQQEYGSAYNALAGEGGLAAGSPEQALIDALRRVHDLELQYIYRAGLQDGINLKDPAFLTAGLE